MQSVYNGHPCTYHGHPSICAVFVLRSSVSEVMDFKDGVTLYCYLIPHPQNESLLWYASFAVWKLK